MTQWVSFKVGERSAFGTLSGEVIDIHEGDMFALPSSTGRTVALSDVQLTLPCLPGKFIGLWNNYHAQAVKQNLTIPAEPLYFIKPSSSCLAHEGDILAPAGYEGRVVYEGELGIVIGKVCKNLTADEASAVIFGVTCVNDVTAIDLLQRDASFTQWTRAKGCDTFGAFGPCITTGLNLSQLRVRTLVNGRERQNHPISDMIFSPAQIVAALSQDMTLMPGDLIACGTSLGVLPMKPGTVVEVAIDGVGVLRNTFAPLPLPGPGAGEVAAGAAPSN